MTFAVGDRVKLNPDTAEGWVQPLRGFAQKGRAGTILRIFKDRSFSPNFVVFDVGRKGCRPETGSFRDQDLVLFLELGDV